MTVLFPEVELILTPATGDNQVTLSLRDRFSRQTISLDDAGTGVGQTLHLVTSVLCLPPGRIFLIDEPHAFLHPAVERLLVDFLREHDEHWYVCATHSPVFINAAEPEHSWLVTRDEDGTHLRSIFNERLSRKHVLQELGIHPGDVAFAERVLFVEGPTEERVFPILLRRLGWDPSLENCAIVGLGGSSTAQPFSRAVSELGGLLQIDFTICLDGDMRSKYGHLRCVRFLHVNELEDLFLEDAAAVREALLRDFDDPTLGSKDDVAGAWPVSRVAEYVRERRKQNQQLQASSILAGLAHEMGTDYHKPFHGPVIAELLSDQVVEPLRATFKDFFK